MRFVKIKFKDGETQWRLVLSNEEEVYQYHDLDVERNFLERWHGDSSVEGSRAHTMNTVVEMGVRRLKENEKTTELQIIANFQDRKALAMLKQLNFDEVCLNQGGGFCGLNSFLRMHKAEVIETIYKSDLGFPEESEVTKSDLVILENSNVIDPRFINQLEDAQAIIPGKVRLEFTNLKSRDRSYVFKSIMNTKAVAVETQALDPEQVESFIKMFLGLPNSLTIYIKMFDTKILELYDGFKEAQQKHKIIFL